jgi:hypothetical protein
MPVLFMRLKNGRLWPSAVVEDRFDRWDAVVSDIENDQCVPVLGPGLVESALGSRRDMARDWAERYEFPLAPRNRDDLAQVAQYLAYRQSKNLAINEPPASVLHPQHLSKRAGGDRRQAGLDLLTAINKGTCNGSSSRSGRCSAAATRRTSIVRWRGCRYGCSSTPTATTSGASAQEAGLPRLLPATGS